MKIVVAALMLMTSSAFAEDAIRFVIKQIDVKAATAEFDPAGRPAVMIELTPAAAMRFERITCANVGKMLELVVENRIITTAKIVDCIQGGKIQLSGNFTVEETRQIARTLQPNQATATANSTAWLEQLWQRLKQLLESILRMKIKVGEQWTY
jgi:preprotein translocase subunit SecD